MSTTRASNRGVDEVTRTTRDGARQGLTARQDLHSLRLTTRGRAVVALLAVAVAGGVGLTAQSAVAGGPSEPVPVVAHVVEPGETLWEIAARTVEPGEDVRDVVARLAELNGLGDGGLQAGQQLLVPVR